jgi:hypothetical protein
VKIWRVTDWVVENEIKEPYDAAPSTTFFRRLRYFPFYDSVTNLTFVSVGPQKEVAL